MEGKRILLLGAYSMEVIECGGALLKNVRAGGVSHAAILFAGEQMRADLRRSAELLKVSLEFLDMDTGEIIPTRAQKLKLVEVIRRFRPEIIITQDTEHCVSDLDPGRRPVMPLVLEAIALASRAYALDELPGLEPCPCAAIYYMAPEHPNCLVDIADVWEEKCAAMDRLDTQLVAFGGPCSPEEEALRATLVPGWSVMKTPLERGRAWKRVMDRSCYMYPGATGHQKLTLSEQYRREGCFELEGLLK